MDICPRCGERECGLGTSRLDSSTHICGVCENSEAMEDAWGGILQKEHWKMTPFTKGQRVLYMGIAFGNVEDVLEHGLMVKLDRGPVRAVIPAQLIKVVDAEHEAKLTLAMNRTLP